VVDQPLRGVRREEARVVFERTFQRPVAAEELDIANFRTVDSIVAFVEKGLPAG